MDPGLYVIFIILFILSGFFSGTEIALMSLPSHKIDTLVKQKRFGAKTLSEIKSNTDKLLITILVGNNLVNVYTAALATQISISIARSSGIEESLAIGIATGVITFLILVFGEIVPKSFASKNAESISLWVAYPYKFLMIILWPVIFILEFLIKAFTGKNVASKVTEEEIETFIDLGKDSGTLEDDDHERLKNTLEFSGTLIEEVMIPRVRMRAISDEKTIQETFDFYMQNTHSRIPVYHETIDNIVGIVTIRDLLKQKLVGKEKTKLSELRFEDFVKAPLNQPIDILLETFKKARQHIAIAKDEYGGVAGIVTLEDIVEEIFGEIHDETDSGVDEIVEKSEGVYSVDSSILFGEIVEKFEIELVNLGIDEKEFGGETLSYVITHKLERFPEKGESLSFDIYDEEEQKTGEQLSFQILEIDDSIMGKVEVKKKGEKKIISKKKK